MRFFRVIRIVYIKSQVEGRNDVWAGKILDLLSEVISEPNNWTDGYEDYRKAVWDLKRQKLKLPKEIGMEIILQAYSNNSKKQTNPFSTDSYDDRIITEREWCVPVKGVSLGGY
jgi:hypothetical protein